MGKKNLGRRITAYAQRRFLRALRGGARIEDAARAAGHTMSGFYGLRSRDPRFARKMAAALAESADGERVLIRGNNRRRLQRRRMRHVRFDTGRKEVFLNHFAGCGDAREAAEVAGIDHSTVYKHRRKDPVFAAAFSEALEQCYARLEVEAMTQRLKAQQRLMRALDEGVPTGDVAEEFERVMKLLERWDRRNGRLGVRAVAPERRRSLSFDEAITLLEKKLRHLDIPILKLPPPVATRYDEPGEGEDSGPEEIDEDKDSPK
ncbi:MAG: hypothetical protein WBR13_04040 [Allosphingosinicella sp.]